ncbi:MAG: hypothetical protein FWH49_08000, partial [Clostridiales bacterium]|nr:hypothetical protein [Clostridiales bacterium]
MKKSLALLLSLLMVFAVVAPAFAATNTYLVTFYALDGTTFVCSQMVPDGGLIDGGNWDLYNSWSNEGGMMATNYKMQPGWEAVPYTLEDLDTGEWFNWKEVPITKPTNVTIAVNKFFTVSFYALDGTTFVCSQVVQGGRYINGGDTALYYSWNNADALYNNYQLTDNLRIRTDWLKDLDTGEEFNWKETTINSDLNVTIALENQYNLPPSPVTPVELVVERPTLICLGFEWYVEGDDNGNATVAVSYREAGTQDWQEALPLLRINR